MQIYNERNLILKEYWISSPYPTWWDGKSFIEQPNGGRFIKGKLKSICNIATVYPKDFDKVLRKALVSKFKHGNYKPIYVSSVHQFKYRYGKRNRLISDHEFGMINL